jgi:hypothetical protein
MAYLLQTASYDGMYRNPYKSGGQAVRYTAWKTVAKFDTLEAARQAWLNFKQDGLTRRRIKAGGKVLITPDGKVYELRDGDLWFKEQI